MATDQPLNTTVAGLHMLAGTAAARLLVVTPGVPSAEVISVSLLPAGSFFSLGPLALFQGMPAVTPAVMPASLLPTPPAAAEAFACSLLVIPAAANNSKACHELRRRFSAQCFITVLCRAAAQPIMTICEGFVL